MLEGTQSNYQQAIALIREFKNKNDLIDRKVSQGEWAFVATQIKSEQLAINKLVERVQNIIKNITNNYLDPQSARKIGSLKQHLLNQQKRRAHLSNLSPTVVELVSHQKSNQQLQLQINDFDFEFQSRLLNEKHKQIESVHQTMKSVSMIAKETAELTMKQGQQLEYIGDKLTQSHQNIKQSNKELVSANEYQRQSRSKYIWVLVLLLVLAIVIVALVIFL